MALDEVLELGLEAPVVVHYPPFEIFIECPRSSIMTIDIGANRCKAENVSTDRRPDRPNRAARQDYKRVIRHDTEDVPFVVEVRDDGPDGFVQAGVSVAACSRVVVSTTTCWAARSASTASASLASSL